MGWVWKKKELYWNGGTKNNPIRWARNESRGLVSSCIGRHFQLMDRLDLSVFYFTLRPNAAIFLQWVSPTYIGFEEELRFLLAAITKSRN
jgi:hypothetical protein